MRGGTLVFELGGEPHLNRAAGSAAAPYSMIGPAYINPTAYPLRRVTDVLASAGRMAFTNYLMQTVLCTLLFYGHGLGLYGRVERIRQPLIIVCVWALELAWSPLWLSRFRFGPIEWLWRSLTYRSLQPMRREGETR